MTGQHDLIIAAVVFAAVIVARLAWAEMVAMRQSGHCWTMGFRHHWAPWERVSDLPWSRKRCLRCGIHHGRVELEKRS